MFNLKFSIMRSNKEIRKNASKNIIAQTFRVMKEDIDNYLIKHLMKSMSRRIAACNLVHGDHTTH